MKHRDCDCPACQPRPRLTKREKLLGLLVLETAVLFRVLYWALH